MEYLFIDAPLGFGLKLTQIQQYISSLFFQVIFSREIEQTAKTATDRSGSIMEMFRHNPRRVTLTTYFACLHCFFLPHFYL